MQQQPVHEEAKRIALSEAVIELRTAKQQTAIEFARELGRAHNTATIHIWEQGRGKPSNHTLSRLSTMAYQLGRHDLAAVFKKAVQTEVKRVPRPEDAEVSAARQHSRERALLEVLHLIDERAVDIRRRSMVFDRDYERGMSISDIVATEVDTLKGLIRTMPTYPKPPKKVGEGRP